MTAVAIVIGLALGLSGFLVAVLALESASKSKIPQRLGHPTGPQTIVSVFVGNDEKQRVSNQNSAFKSLANIQLAPCATNDFLAPNRNNNGVPMVGLPSSPARRHLLGSGQPLRRVF
jgi:hypothetical protein